MSNLISRVAAHYGALGAAPRAGVPDAGLSAFEAEREFQLPRPVRDFYGQLDGLDGEVPEFAFHHLQLWPLVELTRVAKRVAEFRGIPDYGPIVKTLPNAAEFIAFGDGACWSHVLAFRLTPHAGPVLWISGSAYAQVADDFVDFWERYLANPDSVLWPTEEQIIASAV